MFHFYNCVRLLNGEGNPGVNEKNIIGKILISEKCQDIFFLWLK